MEEEGDEVEEEGKEEEVEKEGGGVARYCLSCCYLVHATPGERERERRVQPLKWAVTGQKESKEKEPCARAMFVWCVIRCLSHIRTVLKRALEEIEDRACLQDI